MQNITHTNHQMQCVNSFQDLMSTPLQGSNNVICWNRTLEGDFAEIVNKIDVDDNIVELHHGDLLDLHLTEQGKIARDILLQDMKALAAHGAAPSLNVIKYYETDDFCSFLPTDVYSFHVDRSPIPVDTILCTYYGATSEILLNTQGTQKVLIPEIREELKKIYHGAESNFEDFLRENFFDLHYQAQPDAQLIKLGIGHMCRLSVDYPGSTVLPCLHRAPKEQFGQKRLLLIC